MQILLGEANYAVHRMERVADNGMEERKMSLLHANIQGTLARLSSLPLPCR